MSIRSKSGSIFNKIKAILGRFFIPILVLLVFLLMLIGKADIAIVEQIKTTALDIANPIIRVVSYPAQGISYIIDSVNNIISVKEENIRLKEENKVLVEWRNYAQKLEYDLERLIKTTNYIPPPEASFVTAKIIADSGSSFSQTIIAIAGKNNGIEKDMIAITDEGVVGRVLYSGRNTSRIILLNDINSRLPVVIGKNKLRAMLIGTNKKHPTISFLPIDSQVEVGDKITTSGIGGIFPPDLNVGVVSKVSEDEILATLYFDRNLLSFVKLVDYNLKSMLPENDNLSPLKNDHLSRLKEESSSQ